MFPMFPFIIFPPAPDDYNLPPTLYSIMNSIVNYDKEEDEQTKIKDLASAARSEIFDFNYTLTNKISKEDFECMILNHFIMRRIGYDTMTAFKIALNVKLNSIMPMYNKMFDMLDGWDLFNDGEEVTRQVADNRTTASTGAIANTVNTTNNQSSTNVVNETTSQTGSNVTQKASISDRRYSDAPQNRLSDVQDGSYVSEYNYDTNNDTINDSSTTSQTGNQSTNNITNNSINTSNNTSSNNNITDNGTLSENITRTPADKIKIYKEFMESKTSIYEMIFKDLDVLFYGLA